MQFSVGDNHPESQFRLNDILLAHPLLRYFLYSVKNEKRGSIGRFGQFGEDMVTGVFDPRTIASVHSGIGETRYEVWHL
ncbi:MAG: hypothetical protein OXI16_14245 [Chloroflexota bacterium]|nr:hypothetical protein [Chloroflexota bacterium]MDE2688639.1 hypothetical protein [Chloroflexota bacterium]